MTELPPLLDGYQTGYASGYEDGFLAAWPTALEKAYRVLNERMVAAYGEDYIPTTPYAAIDEQERAA